MMVLRDNWQRALSRRIVKDAFALAAQKGAVSVALKTARASLKQSF
jgi:hypothetical protein